MASNGNEPANETEAVKLLYGVTIGDIREFKARQWDVTKWAIAVILALIIPRVLGDENLPPTIVQNLFWIGLVFGIWAVVVILRLQWSLRSSRQDLERYKTDWSALGSAYGDPKHCHTSFFRDWYVWLFQIALIVAALDVLAWATREADLVTVLMQQFR